MGKLRHADDRASGAGNLTVLNHALVTGTALSIGTSGVLYIGANGYLALSGSDATNYNNLYSLINNGKVRYGSSSSYTVLSLSNYNNYVTLAYYSDVTTCDVLDSYELSGAYTVLLGVAAVPEPSTWALLGGFAAFGFSACRRKWRDQVL